MQTTIVMFAILLVVSLVVSISRGTFASSQFGQLAERYPLTDKEPESFRYIQSGVVNGLCFNGTLALCITTSHLHIMTTFPMPRRGPAAIPLRDLSITATKTHLRYTAIHIRNSEWTIGLESGWIRQLQAFQR